MLWYVFTVFVILVPLVINELVCLGNRQEQVQGAEEFRPRT